MAGGPQSAMGSKVDKGGGVAVHWDRALHGWGEPQERRPTLEVSESAMRRSLHLIVGRLSELSLHEENVKR